MSDDMTIGPAGPERRDDVAAVLADAFADDPVYTWMQPDRARRHAGLAAFFVTEADAMLAHGCSLATPHADAAVLVVPHDRLHRPLMSQAVHLPTYLRLFGRSLPRAAGLEAALTRRHPRHPHLYVANVGVAAHARGQGLGTRLLEAVFAQADATGLPTYLEATTPDSARLYRRLGFVTHDVVRPYGSPPLELMTRPPARVS